MKHAVIRTLDVVAGARSAVLRAVLAHRRRCLRDEPGTLQVEVLVPRDEPHRIYLYELFCDVDACDAHLGGDSMSQMKHEVGHLVSGLAAVECQLGAQRLEVEAESCNR
jgi:autoinducer 2-degrading protein